MLPKEIGMLRELKFVMGAVAKKDFIPAMSHFAIEGGRVRSFNGTLALCSPIPFDIDCTPKADTLIRAISNCTDTVTLSMTPAGKLRVQSGKFKAFVDCVHDQTPHVEPEGERVDFDGAALLQAFKTVASFIGDDASRPWTNGVLLRGQSAFATNNVMLVEYWVGAAFPIVVNVPRAAIKEMIRINEAPTYAQVTANSLTFHYSDGRWVRTQLFSAEWPDLSKVLDRACNATPIDERIFEAVDTIKPFADKMGRVFIKNGVLSTSPELSEGAVYEVPELEFEGVYSIEMVKLLKGVAKQIDFTAYPNPCIFYGDKIRGAIIGMRS